MVKIFIIPLRKFLKFLTIKCKNNFYYFQKVEAYMQKVLYSLISVLRT